MFNKLTTSVNLLTAEEKIPEPIQIIYLISVEIKLQLYVNIILHDTEIALMDV